MATDSVLTAAKTVKECRHCGKPLDCSKRSTRQYCGDYCRGAHWRENNYVAYRQLPDPYVEKMNAIREYSPDAYEKFQHVFRMYGDNCARLVIEAAYDLLLSVDNYYS